MGLEIDFAVVAWSSHGGERECGARISPADRPPGDPPSRDARAASGESEQELLRPSAATDPESSRRSSRNLSKNVLLGFSAFDLFLSSSNPEFSERVTFVASADCTREPMCRSTAAYLEAIGLSVRVVNQTSRHAAGWPSQRSCATNLE